MRFLGVYIMLSGLMGAFLVWSDRHDSEPDDDDLHGMSILVLEFLMFAAVWPLIAIWIGGWWTMHCARRISAK